MSDKRQNNQLVLAFAEMSRSEAPRDSAEGTEALMAKREAESKADSEQLMEQVCERRNCEQALARVKSNKGSAGIDGITVEQLPAYLKKHWPTIREQLLSGTYKPQPVKRVAIPKPEGGMRQLGIPTALDRFIQQAVMQVLQKHWDRTFSDGSYGFRPGRSTHQAVAQAQHAVRELAQVVLPVGELTKAEVRDQARRLGLRTAAKPESMDVCFVARDERR